MTLSDRDRELLERALDTMAGAMGADAQARHDALVIYESAVPIVRERPAGARRVRSDFNRARRNADQLELGA